jgi:hypothetical protein
MADSIMLATARAFSAVLWMQDADFGTGKVFAMSPDNEDAKRVPYPLPLGNHGSMEGRTDPQTGGITYVE